MKIETVSGFNSNHMVGFINNDLLTFKRFCDSTQPIQDLTKEDLDIIIRELQKLYSIMNSVQKQVKGKLVTAHEGETARPAGNNPMLDLD